MSTGHTLSPNNCEALCLSADELLEKAKSHEEAGNLHVSNLLLPLTSNSELRLRQLARIYRVIKKLNYNSNESG